MFWQQQRGGGLARPHHLPALRGAQGAHLRSIRYGDLLWPRLTLLISLHSCNYPVFPFAFTLPRLSGNLFDFSGTSMKALASSFGTKLRHELMQQGGVEWDEMGRGGCWAWHDDVRHTEEFLAVSVARMYYIIL
jgi:hypothetical protein